MAGFTVPVQRSKRGRGSMRTEVAVWPSLGQATNVNTGILPQEPYQAKGNTGACAKQVIQ